MLCVPHLGATENWTIEQYPESVLPSLDLGCEMGKAHRVVAYAHRGLDVEEIVNHPL
jgi:hypothetical protein